MFQVPQEIDIVLYGKPGSGKGTLAKRIGRPHLDMGLAFRERKDPAFRAQYGAKMNDGWLLPDDVTIKVFDEMYDLSNILSDSFVLDGFPRSSVQAIHLVNKLRRLKRSQSLVFVEYDGPNDEVCFERLSRRAKDEGRLDDKKVESIRNRIEQFKERKDEMQNFFRALSPGMHMVVDASQSPEEVWRDFSETVSTLVTESSKKKLFKRLGTSTCPESETAMVDMHGC